MGNILNITTIDDLHRMLGLEKPKHPLISVVDFAKSRDNYSDISLKYSTELYALMLKKLCPGQLMYGRRKYDFQEGTLMIMTPGQTLTIEPDTSIENQGWGLFFHPDLLRRSHLAKKISDYNFFSYDLNESLHLSDKEKIILTETVYRIETELSENIDSNSLPLIISNIELMLNYCTRFYNRQFITRANFDSDYVSGFRNELKQYFIDEVQLTEGIPSVAYFAEKLHLSPKYFSDLVKNETGKNAQTHIHDHILELSKNILLGDNYTISEVAYKLGFEYPQYFSRMFKKKTGMTPAQYRGVN